MGGGLAASGLGDEGVLFEGTTAARWFSEVRRGERPGRSDCGEQVLAMADALGAGIAKQFPDKVM